MILSVHHRTHYRFDRPRRALVQSLRLRPAECEGQTVLDWTVDVPGATVGTPFRDGAGDTVQTVTVSGQVEEVTVEAAGRVATTDCQGVLKGHRESAPPLAYLRDTRLTAPAHGVRDLAGDALSGLGEDILERAHALSRAVRDAVAYDPGSTHMATTAADALSQGRGVCQDHAHLLIAAALCDDIPARYVAGYLFAGGSHPMGEASHAWAELHVPGLGWVGFDPANGCCPDDNYVRLGSGLDAVGAAPIRGLTEGLGDEALEIRVSVSAAQQQ